MGDRVEGDLIVAGRRAGQQPDPVGRGQVARLLTIGGDPCTAGEQRERRVDLAMGEEARISVPERDDLHHRNDISPLIPKRRAQCGRELRRPELADRARVGKLSDMVIALGAFKGSTEITPAGSASGFHEFTETFASGTLDEKYELDSDGKIVRFHIGPKPTP